MMDLPRHHNSSAHTRGLLDLAGRVAKLKSVPRTGWLDRGIDPQVAESVADHSLGVALLAWACAIQRRDEGASLDPERVLKLALVHDLAEAEIGDLTPYDPAEIPGAHEPVARRAFLETRHIRDTHRDDDKRAREDAAMRTLIDALPGATGAEFEEVWDELRLGTSAEARFVKQVDRLETFLQSRHYLRADPNLPMSSFRQEVVESIDDPLLGAIRDTALADEASDSDAGN